MKFISFGEDVLYSFRRTFLIMRFILFISFICPALAFSASSYSQEARISLKLSNVRVSEVLKTIEEQSEFVFFYQDQQIDLNRKVSISIENENINRTLDQLLKGTDNVYKILDRQIIIGKSRKDIRKITDDALKVLNQSFLQPTKRQIKGIVRDEKGDLVPGANVLVKGMNIGTITDLKGEFSLDVPIEAKFLIVSFVGYQPQELSIENINYLTVNLRVDISQLEEVAVTAQAKGQKSAIRQQINSNTLKNVVAPDRLQENPDANATEAIGRLPGISLLRSGGEGTGLVIRGLEPRYSSVSLNGILLPSTSGTNRGTSLSGISQYALQGVEVYKSLTADMDANSVAGTVNLKLREAPENLQLSLMAQGGYNQLNNYYGNYKLLGEVSNRFLNNKLGVLFTANAERVNRSIQTMSAAYGIDSGDPEDDILLNAISLNDIHSIIYRQSYMLSFDYKVSKGTTLMLYGMYSNSANDYQQQAKSYGLSGAGSVNYSFIANPNDQKKILQTSLSGESKLNLLNIKTDYGVVLSRGNISNLNGRLWNFVFDNASTSENTTIEKRKLDPSEVVPLFTDDPENYMDNWLY
ncbi:MAG: carboxypeptidase-like regulatory domain-containing protein, partial [Bacteroidales bacterium]|nr:carboxypeptidase-like regulatory domain-containing protein [Bacteroidales bacterium]